MKLRRVGGGSKLRDPNTTSDRLRRDVYDAILGGTLGALTGSLVKRTNKVAAGVTGACVGALNKAISVTRGGTMGALTGTVVKRTNKVLSGVIDTLNGALTTAHGFNVALVGEIGAITGTLTKRTNKVLSGVPGTLTGVLMTAAVFGRILGGTLGDMSGTVSTFVVGHITGAVSGVSTAIRATIGSILGRTRAVSPDPKKNDTAGPDQ